MILAPPWFNDQSMGTGQRQPHVLLLPCTCLGERLHPQEGREPRETPRSCCGEGTGSARDRLAAAATPPRQSRAVPRSRQAQPVPPCTAPWPGTAPARGLRRAWGQRPRAPPQPCPRGPGRAGPGSPAGCRKGRGAGGAAEGGAALPPCVPRGALRGARRGRRLCHRPDPALPREGRKKALCPVAVTDVFNASRTTARRGASRLRGQPVLSSPR